MTPYEIEAHALGVQAAKAAASWAVDGNSSQDHIRRVVDMLDAGDPEVFDYLPQRPDLSGEWADSPTPVSLYRDITGRDPVDSLGFETEHGQTMDAIANAWEAGVDETFEVECERILRAALETTV